MRGEVASTPIDDRLPRVPVPGTDNRPWFSIHQRRRSSLGPRKPKTKPPSSISTHSPETAVVPGFGADLVRLVPRTGRAAPTWPATPPPSSHLRRTNASRHACSARCGPRRGTRQRWAAKAAGAPGTPRNATHGPPSVGEGIEQTSNHSHPATHKKDQRRDSPGAIRIRIQHSLCDGTRRKPHA